MYCPKCKQTFEEGSRRFCPADGTRVVAEIAAPEHGGVFANLIPHMDAISDIDAELPDASRANILEMDPDSMEQVPPQLEDEIFFELDDEPVSTAMDEAAFSRAARTFGSLEPAERSSMSAKPEPRKVNPYEISDGGVNLKEDRPDIFTGDFDVSDPESFVGRTVKSRYKITDFLGGDETGLAYLGQDKIADKKVLVRILLEEEPDEVIASILAEERVSLAHLSHPNIARLVDSGTFTNGIQFLVTVYFDGLSVRDILDIYGKFPPERAGRIIRQAASALSQAHQVGILHRDVRPENLIIDTEGEIEQVVVVNFGASNGEPTELNAVYKAPEILDGRMATAGSDIFSLADVAYEMLTGRLPFEGASTKEILRSQYSGLSLRPTHVDSALPPVVDEVLEKAFAYNSSERYTKAREFGDAFYGAVTGTVATQTVKAKTPAITPIVTTKPVVTGKVETLGPAVKPDRADEPSWKRRSSDPLALGTTRTKRNWLIAILVLLAVLGLGWYYIVKHQSDEPAVASDAPVAEEAERPPVDTIGPAVQGPPMPRNVPQPANTNFYQPNRRELTGDLKDNYVGFGLYYPKNWKFRGPQPGQPGGTRGKFIDISRESPDGKLMEQMLVSYYPSKGTFTDDATQFPELVKETNDALAKLLPNYMPLSEGSITVNGGWHAYEIKFQAGGTLPSGQTLNVWGRRIFMPAARPGVHDGFEITMLATSLAEDVRGVDDVGVRGQLAPILYSFEPSQNY
jgi:serine/threonine protein kinase